MKVSVVSSASGSFRWNYKLTLSMAIMQVVFSAVHYAHTVFIVIMQVTLSFIGCDITNRQLSASTSTSIAKELKELRIKNPLNLIFSYLNINSIKNKLSDLQQVICDSVDVLTIAETKIDSSFPTAQFRLNYHTVIKVEVFLFVLN